MPAWLFSRARRRKQSMSDGQKHGGEQASVAVINDAQGLRRRNTRRSSRRKRRNLSKSSLDSPTQKESDFSPTNTFDEKQPFPPANGSVEDITALPVSHVLGHSPHLRPVTRQTIHIPYTFHLNADSRSRLRSSGSLPLAMLSSSDKENLPPNEPRTKLRKHNSVAGDYTMPRRKSSKRKDPIREEEIRAMSAPLPMKRPATHSGGLLKRDSKKMRHGLNRHFERPTSDISLPMEDSLHSSISGGSEQRSWKVSGFEVFTARPKIRYHSGTYQPYHTHTPIWENLRSDSQKDKHPENSRHGRRIGDLAEDMDAASLREVMERDRRRKEKKRKQDDERLRQRLERRAEKQRAKEQRRDVEKGTLDRKRSGPGLIGLGIEQPDPSTRPMHPLEREAAEAAAAAAAISSEQASQHSPMQIDHPSEYRPLTPDHTDTEAEKPSSSPREEQPDIVPSPKHSPKSPPTPSRHSRVPSNISHLPALASEVTPPSPPAESPSPHEFPPKKERRSSGQSSRRMRIWSALFRRSSKSKRSSIDRARMTPSDVSFSNTSRESMAKQQMPAHLVTQQIPTSVFTRKASGTPVRTRSKFREDLPEFPLSPPDSRVQSPEVEHSSPRPIPARRGHPAPSNIDTDMEGMGGVSYEESSEERISPNSPTVKASSGIMSQSMASVDSEASWLSGKPMRRRSAQPQGYLKRGSISSSRAQEEFNPSYEELGIPDDEYFRRLTPGPEERPQSGTSKTIGRKASSTAMVTGEVSDNEDAVSQTESQQEVLHTGVARRPTVVHSHAHVKSREGLLNDFQEGESAVFEGGNEASPSEEAASPFEEAEQDVKFQRATSINLGQRQHARQLSAGSAKLLDIPAKRSSRGHSPAVSEIAIQERPALSS